MSTQGRARRYARNGRRRRGVLDLNVPPVETLEQAGGPVLSVDQRVPIHQPAPQTQPTIINIEERDDNDDIVISSRRAFEEAKSKSRRRATVVDVEAEEVAIRLGLIQANKRRKGHPNLPIINCELYVNLEGSNGSMRERAKYIFEYLKFKFLNLATRCMQLHSRDSEQYLAPSPLPPPSPKEPTFSCPVCMDPLVEEVATKCGHIFCKACITAAINAQHKCPTCRKKLTSKNLIRVYLPTTK